MSKDNLILKIKELKLERSEFYKLDWRQHPNLEELISSCKISPYLKAVSYTHLTLPTIYSV